MCLWKCKSNMIPVLMTVNGLDLLIFVLPFFKFLILIWYFCFVEFSDQHKSYKLPFVKIKQTVYNEGKKLGLPMYHLSRLITLSFWFWYIIGHNILKNINVFHLKCLCVCSKQSYPKNWTVRPTYYGFLSVFISNDLFWFV